MAEVPVAEKTVEPLHKRAARGGIVSGLNFALSMLLNLVQVPLLLRFWPQDMYGLWLSVGALATTLTALDGGHQAYVGNLLNRFYVENRDRFKLTLASGVCMAAFTSGIQILGIIALCGSGYAAKWLNITDSHSLEFSVSIVIYSVGWITTGSVGSILVRLFAPTGHFVRSTCWAMGMRVTQFIVVVLAASFGWGLVATTTLFSLSIFLFNVFLFWDIRRLFPEYFPWWNGGNWNFGFRNFSKSFLVTVVSLLDAVSLQGVVLLVTNILGSALVPLFTTLRTLANTAMQGTGFLLNPIQPDIVRYHVEKQPGKLTATFGLFWFITGLGLNGGMLLGLLFVEPVYVFWTQGALVFDRMLFAWLAAAVLVRTLASPFGTYLSSINQLKAQLVSGAVRTGIITSAVVLFAPQFGLSGVGAAVFFGELFGSLAVPAVYSLIELRALSTKREGFGIGWPLLSTLMVAGCLLWYGGGGELGLLIGFASGAVFIAGLMQWRGLSDEVKARLMDLMPRLRSSG